MPWTTTKTTGLKFLTKHTNGKVLDNNCPVCHSVNLSNLKLTSFPLNTTCHLQPCNASIICTRKVFIVIACCCIFFSTLMMPPHRHNYLRMWLFLMQFCWPNRHQIISLQKSSRNVSSSVGFGLRKWCWGSHWTSSSWWWNTSVDGWFQVDKICPIW